MSPLPLLLLLLLLLLRATLAQPGLTRSPCADATVCVTPRVCRVLNSAEPLAPSATCPSFDACRCTPPSYVPCSTDDDCTPPELCARTRLFPFVCTSPEYVAPLRGARAAVAGDPPLVPNCGGGAPIGPGGAPVRRAKLVADPCVPGECANGLSCIREPVGDAGFEGFECCKGPQEQCACYAPDDRPVCKDSRGCNSDVGEICAEGPTLPKQCYNRKWLRMNRPQLFRSLTIFGADDGNRGDGGGGDGDGDENDGDGDRDEGKDDKDKGDEGSGDDSSGDDSNGDEDNGDKDNGDEGSGEEGGDVEGNGEAGTGEEDNSVEASSEEEGGEGDEVDSEDGAGEEEPICVDAAALHGIPSHELVFEKHRLGRVLCDVNGSCATPGHMVTFNGDAMMMKSYCKAVGCVKKVIHVNSMRYRRRALLASKTDGLMYTAFAARFATRAEEGVLAAAVRVGL